MTCMKDEQPLKACNLNYFLGKGSQVKDCRNVGWFSQVCQLQFILQKKSLERRVM